MSEQKKPLDQSYWANVKRQFKKKKVAVFSLYIAYVLAFIAVFAPFLANEMPIVCKYKGTTYFPVFTQIGVDMDISRFPAELNNVKWKNLNFDWAMWPLIPYSPMNQDEKNIHSKSPTEEQEVLNSRWHHWAGTDELGRDVLSGLIHGTRTAFMVGIVSMVISTFLGIIFGSLAGFFGDENFKMSRIRIWLNIIFFFLALFYAFGVRSYIISDTMSTSIIGLFYQLFISVVIFIGIMVLANLLAIPLKKIPFLGTQVSFPMDMVISRGIEVLVCIPTFFLILLVLAVLDKPNIYWIMLIIGVTSWTGIARYIRAELLKIRNLEYVEAAHALGYDNLRILFRHAIPNALSPVLIAVAFGIASAILTESGLSFLGFGSGEMVTWGSLLSAARQTPQAWWLAIFPGVAIFLTVTVFNLIGEGLTDALDPRLKQ